MTAAERLQAEKERLLAATGFYVPPYRMANLMKAAAKIMDIVIKADTNICYEECRFIMAIVNAAMVYKLIQPHDATDNPDWTPPATPAMWAAVSKEGEDGTLENPITAARGMEYVYGKYYRDPEDGKLYLCKRTGEEEGGKVTLQFLPHELVAQYFEEVQG